MYTVYTLRTILRLDGIGDWPGGKSAFNCPPTTDMKLGGRGRVPTTGTTLSLSGREFGVSTRGRPCCLDSAGNPARTTLVLVRACTRVPTIM